MGEDSSIQWTDHTFNPWIGCAKVSAECDHCYAESGSKRLGAQHHLQLWEGDRFFTGESYWKQLAKWNRAAEKEGVRARVFCASYSDLFEDRPELVAPRGRLMGIIPETPWLDYLLLSKRPENMVRLADPAWHREWPANVWAGTTVGLASSLPRAIELVCRVPAVMKFLSIEPMLEGFTLNPPVCPDCWGLDGIEAEDGTPFCDECETEMYHGSILDPLNEGIGWVIVGGESGPKARPFDLQWARSVVRECDEAGVPVFVKQLGSEPHDSSRSIVGGWSPGDPEPDTRLRLKDRKGGDMAEWPEDLRVREFPKAVS